MYSDWIKQEGILVNGASCSIGLANVIEAVGWTCESVIEMLGNNIMLVAGEPKLTQNICQLPAVI